MAFYYARASYADARTVIVGMPLDRTSSFVPGTRFGPDMCRAGAANIESFSPYQRRDVMNEALHDTGNLEFTFGSPDAPFELIASTVRACYADGKNQLALGGEHTITPFIVKELLSRYPDLCVVQYDAHSDLREEFLGEAICHATAMRRVLDFIPRERLHQLGIRSFADPSEMDQANLHAFEVETPAAEVRRAVGSRPLYITLDADVLDPGTMPDVQTPQPGGCSYRELAHSLAAFSGMNVVGCDLVEVCPRAAQPSAGASTAAELVRELALLLSPA